MRKIRKGFNLKIVSLALSAILLCANATHAFESLRLPIDNKHERIAKILKLLSGKSKEMACFELSDGETSVLLVQTDKNDHVEFDVYVKKEGRWTKIRPVIQDTTSGSRFNLHMELRGDYVQVNGLDLGEYHHPEVSKLIFCWIRDLALAKGVDISIKDIRNPRILTLLSKVSDFKFDMEYLYGKRFFVGKSSTPTSFYFKSIEKFGRGSPYNWPEDIEQYAVEINGDYERWFDRSDDSGDFQGWKVVGRETYAEKTRYMINGETPLNLVLEEKGIIKKDGKVIGQVLGFIVLPHAEGKPIAKKGGLLDIKLLQKSPALFNETGMPIPTESVKDRIPNKEIQKAP